MYGLDDDLIKEYFPINRTLNKVLEIYEELETLNI